MGDTIKTVNWESIIHTANAVLTSGAFIVINNKPCINNKAYALGEASVAITKCSKIVVPANTGEVWASEDDIYYDSNTEKATNIPNSQRIGTANYAKGTNDTTCEIDFDNQLSVDGAIEIWTHTAGGSLTDKQLCVLGGLIGVNKGGFSQGETAELIVKHPCCEIAKVTGAWSKGDKLYADTSAKKLTKTSTGNTAFGFAAADADSGDATGYVKFDASAQL